MNIGTIFSLCFITLHMIIMVGGFLKLGFQTGGKVSGDVNRIFIEDAMIILFTVGDNADFYDWEYDMYCGDDTIKCFSDEAFDTLLENFRKGMAKQDLSLSLIM